MISCYCCDVVALILLFSVGGREGIACSN
uniref:Uncharacterized protein n=1 Tax=Lepeophtheirus salmonis TaxID=72036 RepID=A0A0K2UX28_LEPSM